MTTARRSTSTMLPLVVLAAVLGVGCAPTTTAPPPGEDARRAVTARLADDFVLPRLQQLDEQTRALVDVTAALDAAAGADATARAAARDALVAVQATWQQLEVMQLGPTGAPSTFTGGLGLREGIHSWPLVSRCGADQQVLVDRFAEPGWVSARQVDVVGLHTLEYLLFRDDAGNDCPEAASLNADGAWAALSPAAIAARRATYARLVAADVHDKVVVLRRAWTDSFAGSLRTAGLAGSAFSSAQQALDEVYAALFTLELVTKDKKLGVPAGLHVDCAAAVCPDKTESPVARLSLRHVEHNLRGARAALFGLHDADDAGDADGAGFDDLLRNAGHDDAVRALDAAFGGALAAVQTLAASAPGTLEDALVTEPQHVRDLYGAVKFATDELKTTLPSLLGLRVPDEGAGDND